MVFRKLAVCHICYGDICIFGLGEKPKRLERRRKPACSDGCLIAGACCRRMESTGRVSFCIQFIAKIGLPELLSNESINRYAHQFYGGDFLPDFDDCWTQRGDPACNGLLLLYGSGRAYLLSAVVGRQFQRNGKRILHTPGLFTAYCGFLPLGICMTNYLVQSGVQLVDVATAIGILAIMIVGMIFIPENAFKSKETAYPFPSSRYFERF